MRFSRLFITARISIPSTEPITEPRPPLMLVPPMMTAAIASISYPLPALA